MEPNFLGNESLVSNMDDEQVARVYRWLQFVYDKSPEKLSKAITLVIEINEILDFFKHSERNRHMLVINEWLSCPIFLELSDEKDIFDQIMKQLEEEYD